jgi:hypothetical protein
MIAKFTGFTRKTISILIYLVLATSNAGAQDWAGARKMCENYGFTPNTNAFAECVQREIHKQGASSTRAAEDDSKRGLCIQRNQQIEERVNFCKRNCDSQRVQMMVQALNSIPMQAQVQSQFRVCLSLCDQQLSMKGEC